VRLALGARQRTVLTWVMWDGLRPIALGLVAGLLLAVGATRWISGMLFQISPTDAPTYITVVGLLLAIACGAVWVPARRAARVDPMTALRAE
jgi:putative ABC transport system permease protein